MKISIIVSMDQNQVIGKGQRLLWHIREDLIRLKNLTKDHVVILGRKTYDSMVFYYNKSGRPMPGKLYIIVTHNKNYQSQRKNTQVVNSVDEAVKFAKEKSKKEIFIIGGQSIFEQTMTMVNKIYLTIIDSKFDGDLYFPDYADFKKIIYQSDWMESNNLKYKFLELER